MFSIKNLFKARSEKDRIEEYLADAVNLVDLENRLRRIDRHEAPWQVKTNQNLAGWS